MTIPRYLLGLIAFSIFISTCESRKFNPDETFTFRACRGRPCTFENLVFSVDEFVQIIIRRIGYKGLNYDMSVDKLYYLEGKYKDINPEPSPPDNAREFDFPYSKGLRTFRECGVNPGDVITNTRHIMFSIFTYFPVLFPDTPYIHHLPPPPPGVGIIE